jgi:hypothetical protein
MGWRRWRCFYGWWARQRGAVAGKRSNAMRHLPHKKKRRHLA